MATVREPSDEARWPALFRRSREPIFVLNRQRRLIFANSPFENLTRVPLAELRGLTCTQRETGHALAELGKTLTPPDNVLQGAAANIRLAEPGADRGPPWWDVDFLPIFGDDGLIGLIGRIGLVGATSPTQRHALPAVSAELRKQSIDRFSINHWESATPELQRIVKQARLLAATGSPAAIIGESGTGKQTLARTIHALGSRKELPCVCLDAERLPAQAVHSVLSGSLGLSRPDGAGLIYFHNPSALPRDLQIEMARQISDRPQVIAGFSVDPRIDVQGGKLAEELWATVGVVTIELPPLRKRTSIFAAYVDVMMRRASDDNLPPSWSHDALDLARGYDWPGNLDELAELAIDLVSRCAGRTVLSSDLPMPLRQPSEPSKRIELPPLDQLLERVEARMIRWALDRAKGNKSKAAELLGVWRPRLLRRIEALNITAPEE